MTSRLLLTAIVCLQMVALAGIVLPPAIQSGIQVGGPPKIVRAMGFDAAGNLYLAGVTFGRHFSAPGTLIGPGGGAQDIFVIKIAASTQQLLYVTEIGGSGFEELGGMVVDSTGAVTLAGRTLSTDFPTTVGAYQEKSAQGGAFLLRLDASGSKLAYSTYFDNSPITGANALAVDRNGFPYIGGVTDGRTLPVTPGAFRRSVPADSTPAYTIGFLSKFSPDGKLLIASTLFGGSYGRDDVRAIAIDSRSTLHIVGAAYSQGFPTSPDAYKAAPSDKIASPTGYLARINESRLTSPGLSQLTYSTLIDASGATAVQVDKDFSSYVAGGPLDFNIEKFDRSGALVYAVTPASSLGNHLLALSVLGDGSLIAAGDTISPSFPTKNTIQPCGPNVSPPQSSFVSGVVMELDPGGKSVLSSFLGGTGKFTSIAAAALDARGLLYLAGTTDAFDFPGGPVLLPSLLASPLPASPATFAFRLDFQSVTTGRPAPACLVNGATFAAAPAVPGTIETIFGSGLGPDLGVQFRLDGNGRVPAGLAGTQVTVGGLLAPILYAQDGQINFIVPQSLSATLADVCVMTAVGQTCIPAEVGQASPGIFRLNQGFAVVNADGTLNTPLNPARLGSVIALFGTGFGPYNPAQPDGAVALPPFGTLLDAVSATFRDPSSFSCSLVSPCPPVHAPIPATVLYAGTAPFQVVGVTQINVKVPDSAFTGLVPLDLQVSDGRHPSLLTTLTVAVQ